MTWAALQLRAWGAGAMLLGLFAGAAHAQTARYEPQRDARAGEMVTIPAGDFVFGATAEDVERFADHFRVLRSWFRREQPAQRVWLPTFLIEKFEVANRQYRAFVVATGHRPPGDWTATEYFPGRDDHPVVNVSREDAEAFCRWAGKRLPSEQEWEKAARGTTPRAFPWGDQITPGEANTVEVGRWDTAPIGSFLADRSPYGVMDMAGNVSEWVADDYGPYQGFELSAGRLYAKRVGIGRGGNWRTSLLYARATNRIPAHSHGHPEQGFRCAASS